jgi:hypothetical protein
VDLGDLELLSHRTWGWFLDRFTGLLAVRSRTSWAWLGADGQADARDILAQGGDVAPWL